MDQDGRTQLVVRGLGRAEIVIGSLTLLPDAGMLFPLALVLAQRAGERITRASLRDLIWPSATEKSSRHSLRQGLYRLHVAGLSLIHISEPTRRTPISYAVFCLKKK